MLKDSQDSPHLAQTALFGRGPIQVQQKEKKPETAPQQQPKLSIVYGVCCKCQDRPATLKSPSGQSIYCAECGQSRCGVHTIADFELETSTGLWLDPCCVKHDWQQQSLVEEIKN